MRDNAPAWFPPSDSSDATGMLPDEIWAAIIAMISDPWVELIAVPAVCHRWKRLCKHHITVDLRFDSFQPPRQPCGVDDAGLAALAGRFLGVRSVRLVDCPHLSAKGVSLLATGHLKDLTAAESYHHTDGLEARVVAITSRSPALEAVTLGFAVLGVDAVFRSLASPTMRAINLANCGTRSMSKAAVLTLVSACPRLAVFNPPARFAADLWLRDVMLCCPALLPDSLHAPRAKGDRFIGAVAARHPDLESLDLSRCPNVTEEGLATIATSLPKLTRLLLTFNYRVTDEAAVKLAAGCPLLEEFDVTGCAVGDVGLAAIARGCPKLDISTLAWGTKTDAYLRTVADARPETKTLDLSGRFVAVTEAGLLAVGAACTDLESLSIAGSSRDTVSAASLDVIAANFEKLKRLDLRGSFAAGEATDAWLTKLATAHPDLEALHLTAKGDPNEVPGLTEAGACAVIRACPKLDLASFVGPPRGDAVVQALADVRPELIEVSLGGDSLTDAGLQIISTSFRKLESLTLTNCGAVTAAGLERVALGCPQLTCFKAALIWGERPLPVM